MFVDTRKVLRLREIVERTGAELVLSSSWRLGASPKAFYFDRAALSELKNEFRRLCCPLWIDITPDLPHSKREKEIYSWLLLHPEVDKFVILDDWADEFPHMLDHLVLTNARFGLTKERAELTIKMLGEKEDV